MKRIILLLSILTTIIAFGQNKDLNPIDFEFSTNNVKSIDENWIKPIIDAKKINDLKLYFKYKSPVEELQSQESVEIDEKDIVVETSYFKFDWKNDYNYTMKFSSLPGKNPFELIVQFPTEGLIYVIDYFTISEEFKNEIGLHFILKVANQENTWYNLNTGLYYVIIKDEESNNLFLFVRDSGITSKGCLKTEQGTTFYKD